MILRSSSKIESAASRDKTRMVISEPFLDGAFMVATDGRILAAVKIEREEKDTDGHVPQAAIKSARKSGKTKGTTVIALNGTAKDVLGNIDYPRPDMGKPPQWSQIVPKKDRKEMVITFDVELLTNLASALGNRNNRVTLKIAVNDDNTIKEGAAIRVETSEMGSDDVGLLMPVRS